MADDDSQGDGVDIVTIAVEMYDSLCDQEARVSEVYHSVDFCISSSIWGKSSDRSQRDARDLAAASHRLSRFLRRIYAFLRPHSSPQNSVLTRRDILATKLLP